MGPTLREMRAECNMKRINEWIAEGSDEIKIENGMKLYHFRIPLSDCPSIEGLKKQFKPLITTKSFCRLQKPELVEVICEFPLLIFKAFDAVYFKDCFIIRFCCFDISHNLVENQG